MSAGRIRMARFLIIVTRVTASSTKNSSTAIFPPFLLSELWKAQAHCDDESAQRSGPVVHTGRFSTLLKASHWPRRTSSPALYCYLVYCRRSVGDMDVEAFDDIG
ncbi:hypothetical protein HDV57DRAFT_491898 [Trichoderma longibrachiatum]